MPAPLVSVVMPVFNQEPYLAEAIDSVLAQRHPALELICVDDGSSDASVAVIRGYGPRVTLICQANAGAGAARNTGVRAARGALLAFADSDDRQLPERIAVQVSALEHLPEVALVASDFSDWTGSTIGEPHALHHRWLGPSRESFSAALTGAFGPPAIIEGLPVYAGVVPRLLASIHFAWVGTMMIRRDAFLEAGGFDPSLTHYEDWDLGSRIGKRRAIGFIDAPLLLYRSHETQLTRRTAALQRAYLRVVERVWQGDAAFLADNGEVVRRALGSAHWQLGVAAEAEGDRRAARGAYLRSVLAYPRQRRAYVDLLRSTLRFW